MPNNILITPGSASIQFSGSVDNSIRLQVQPSGAVDFISESVSLLSISNTGIITTASITVTGGGVTSSLFGTSSWANNSISASFANTASFFTGSVIFPSGLIVTGSILATTVSASLFIGPLTGTASFATSASFATTASFAISSSRSVTSSFATTSSFAVSASWAPSVGGVTSITAGNGLTGGEITSTGTITVDTGSVHFLDGVKKELNTEGVISSSGQVSYTGLSNVPANIVSSSAQVTAFLPAGTVSSSTQVNYTQLQNIPAGIVSSSTFSSPSQGTVRAVINGIQTDVDTGLQTGDSPQFTNLNVSNVITASIVSASTAITASNVRLNGLTDITSTNKVLVLDTATNRVFTTASVGTGGSSGNGFPYDGTVTPAVISGSLIISQSVQGTRALRVTGSVEFRTGSTRVYTSLDDTNNGRILLETLGEDVFLKAGFNGTSIGSNTGDLGIIAAGTQRALINSNGILPATDLGNDLGELTSKWRNLYVGRVTASSGITTPIISASIISSSHVQLVSVVDTTSANKVLVLDTATNKIFTTASVGGGGGGNAFGTIVVAGQSNVEADQANDTLTLVAGTNVTITTNAGSDSITINSTGGTGAAFPYDATVTPAIISGSLIISSSINSPLIVSGSVNDFFEVEVVNASAGNNASADFVVSSNNTTDFGNYAAFGINSTTFNGTLVGGASDAYLYVTSSVGELDIGHAHAGANSNIRFFTNGPNSTANTRVFISGSGNVGINSSSNLQHTLTVGGSVLANSVTASFTGPIVNISELSMAVSGTITASGTVGVSLDLNRANYFTVSGSGTGTVTWTVTNAPPAGRAQTFIIEYTNGGIKTNNWFTNTRWPAGLAPSLTSASANPDLLGFTTDDAGANWRGVLLQRGSA